MAKISLGRLTAGFKDPIRRPRFIVWLGVVLLVGFAFVVITLGATSTRWFCANGCHKVQDDLIASYEKGSHAQISCLACHEPVNANAVTFMLLKGKAMIELYHTVSDTFHFPLNPGSALSQNGEEMPEGQCTQCHSSNRAVTPSAGIIINHKIHADKDIWCTVCHNRVAHPEQDVKFGLKAPDGTPNSKHTSFTKMTACFRCHDLAGKKDAPGTCSTCHAAGAPPGEPESHGAVNWPGTGHVVLAHEDDTAVVEAEKLSEELVAEGIEKRLAEPVSYCSTCHIKSEFCIDCHGMQVPHMSDFALRAHVAVAKSKTAKCVMCHGPVKTGFCESCHHGRRINWAFDKKVPWLRQHATAVKKLGTKGCSALCHDVDYCYGCHARGKDFTKLR
jgi:hypothetical protein